jgi:hypothetical protein
MPTAYEYIKLGMNVQQLRSIASTSIFLGTSLVEFENLEENQPAVRCSVYKTVNLLKAVKVQLEEFGFTRTLEMLQPIEPMQQEMEQALGHAPPGDELILRDAFANTLVGHIKNVLLVLKEEAGEKHL